MRIAAIVLTALVAVLHVLFLILEMFLWTTPFGQKAFNLSPEFAQASAVLAQNQGLYNGFLAAGLVWSFFVGDAAWQRNVRTFFLLCVLVAGVFGGFTAKPSIFVIQALPALLALIAVRMAKA